MSKKKFTGSVGRKGYYIALVLCAAAIGISGFLYYRNGDKPQDPNLGSNPTVNRDDQSALATDPTNPGMEDPKKPEGLQKTVYPVTGQTVAVYAMDSLTYNETTRDWRVHNGIDIAADAGTTVCAAADGEVYSVYNDEKMGQTVVIRHADGYTTKYSSLGEEVSVQPGQTVKAGQAIGTVGNTALMESAIGDHIHFAVTCNGASVDPEVFLQIG